MMLTLRCASDADDGISRFPVLSGPLASCYAPGTEVPERRRMVEMLARASEKEEYNRCVPNARPGERVLRVVVEDHENNPGLCEEARKDTEKRILRAKREECGHRRCNLCTADADGNPPDSGCPLFECGRCLEVADR